VLRLLRNDVFPVVVVDRVSGQTTTRPMQTMQAAAGHRRLWQATTLILVLQQHGANAVPVCCATLTSA